MSVLQVRNIRKSYIVDPVLKDISFIVEPGEKIGLIGANGSGKSTLLQILTGDLSADSGKIVYAKDISIGYLKQETELRSFGTIYESCLAIFHPLMKMEEKMRILEEEMGTLTGSNLENAMNQYSDLLETFEQGGGYSYKSSIRGVLTGLGFHEEDFQRDPATLSGGQKARLALAQLLLRKANILFLDEPTNHLDMKAIHWLEKYLKDFPGAVIVISHDRLFLDRVTEKIFSLEHGVIQTYRGNYSAYMKYHKKEMELRKKQYEDQQKEIKRQEAIIERFTNMGKARLIRQGMSRKKLLDKMKKIDPLESHKQVNIRFTPKKESGQDVLQVENLAMDVPGKHLFSDVNFNIYKGDRVGLIGGNGTGKTTLFHLIMKKMRPTEGQIHLGAHVYTGYFDQEMTHLHHEKTVLDEIWDEYPDLTHYEIRRYLAQFLFVGDDIFQLVGDLSGGERGRLSLLKLMLSSSNFLLMDEPTNHLDIDSKEILEDALTKYEGTVFTISHDRYFLNKICNKIFALEDETITEYLGNYDYYVEKTTLEEDIPEFGGPTRTERKKQEQKEKKRREDEKQRKKELKTLEDKITQLESTLQKIDEELNNPSLYEDFEEVEVLSKNRQETEISLEKAFQEWMELQE
ncbi:MAG: ABC-F family ATP-binding cassette domain-containing protein [Tissierellia bacterium]|nr:ABC-F family ATP-binding cassette domain-containing protein [Tissierellia bacterium]